MHPIWFLILLPAAYVCVLWERCCSCHLAHLTHASLQVEALYNNTEMIAIGCGEEVCDLQLGEYCNLVRGGCEMVGGAGGGNIVVQLAYTLTQNSVLWILLHVGQCAASKGVPMLQNLSVCSRKGQPSAGQGPARAAHAQKRLSPP